LPAPDIWLLSIILNDIYTWH